MAASVRLLARLYINAPKTQTAASLLGGRYNYSKGATGSDEEKDASAEHADEADALARAIRNISRMSPDPQQTKRITRDLKERLQDMPDIVRRKTRSNSVLWMLEAEAAERVAKREATEGRMQVRRGEASEDGDSRTLVDRQRSAAAERTASVLSHLTQESRGNVARRPVQQQEQSQKQQKSSRVPSPPSVQNSVRMQLKKEQDLGPRTMADGGLWSKQAAAGAESAAVRRSSVDEPSGKHISAEMQTDLRSTRPAGGLSSPPHSDNSGTSGSGVEHDITAEHRQPEAESLVARLLRDRAGTEPTRTAKSWRPQRTRPGSTGAEALNATSKQYTDVLHRVMLERASEQAEEVKESITVLGQLMGARTDKKAQPRSSVAGGGYRERDSYKLFEGDRLNAFKPEKWTTDAQESKWNSLWASHVNDAASSAAYLPPSNAFEEHIQWTKEGKLWTFPIDNEAGMEHEKNVPFHEHVFLEKHLANFPKKGPVRHFMELVINGLSKNPHVTVEEKVSHIKWFENYFSEKKKLLDEQTSEQLLAGRDAH